MYSGIGRLFGFGVGDREDRRGVVELNIAVFGERGAGKSSFINVIRGLEDIDKKAALVGPFDNIREPTPYDHPDNPNIKFWALPQMGTKNFPVDTYCDDVKIGKYHVFLIFTATRFKEIDLKLATKLRSMRKEFFFIRTKIDEIVRGERAKRRGSFNEEALLERIRADYSENLVRMLRNTEDIFLISNHCPAKWDFDRLIKAILDVLPRYQRETLTSSLGVLGSLKVGRRSPSQQLFGYVEEDWEESFPRNAEALRGVDEFNIAHSGEPGAGKSSFVNAIRGLQDDERKEISLKEHLRLMEDLEENFQTRLSEMQQGTENSQRQLRELEQRDENSQRQLREMQQREENTQRQLSEMQQREEKIQRQLREMQQRVENSQMQLVEMQQRDENSQRQLREMGQREENSQRQLLELEQREENFQSQLVEMQQREETSQRQLREKRQLLANCQGQVMALRSSREWVIRRNEIQITEKCLGRGGWGSVYEGTYCGCTVAVKQIHDLILSPHNIRLFEREMNIASKCRYPHLLQFIGATNDEGNPLFVTELMEKSLRALLEQRQLSETEIAVISLDVACGLNYLHQKKPAPIIHRDVSSANVLLWRQGDQWRGKVSDYGTANFMHQTRTVAPGAMIYSAPEALTPNQTVKVDVYSFGVLLCEICIRELPNPECREEQVALVTNAVLSDMVRRCLEADPDTRPTMQEIIDELKEFNAAHPVASSTIREWVIPRNEIQITEKCLGRGGWGSVYEGTYCGCTVAVKQIRDLTLSPHNKRLFEREMNIASKCRHPHLLLFIGATIDEGNPLFVTELMEKSLRALLEQRQLSETEIAVISLDVACGLNYLHQKNPAPIIHRDVSSANVLLWRQGDLWRGKVSDYGTANFMQQTMTVAPGAMIYRAPEASTPNQTVKIDVYSFGVLLCEMCIRELPYPECREEQVVLVTNKVLSDLVRRCLGADPDTRPTMQEIIDELKEFKAASERHTITRNI